MGEQRLEGKTALVTGATAGIGAVIVRRFAAEGARVVFCGRSEGPGRALAEQIGDAVKFIAADVTRPEDTRRLADQAAAWLGRIEILVNNAAAPPPDVPLERIDAAALPGYMASVLGSTILMTSALVPILRAQGSGAIINIGSTAAHRANSSSSVYSAS